MPVEIIEKELSYKVVQAAYEVFNGLGPGFLEKIYQEAIVLVLRKNGHEVEVQKSVPVMFLGKQIGVHVLDIVVDGRIILELKAVSEIAPIHKQQALSYLKATGLPLALLINFGAHRLQVTRVVNTKQKEKTA
jgi:GxxExxY protein